MVAALIAIYLASRTYHLGILPIVSDEGTYIDWGVRALGAHDVTNWLASLEDGKQPLLAWLMPPFFSLFDDRLLAGRMVSVLCGLANVGCIAAVASRVAGRWNPATSRTAGIVAGALYIVTPITLIHDRMALYDSLVTTSSLLTLLQTMRWADRPTIPNTIGLGTTVAIAVLTKLSALFFVVLIPVVAMLWNPTSIHAWWRLLHAYLIGAGAYSILYLSPLVDNLADGNFGRYSLTLRELTMFPTDLWLLNASFVVGASATYVGWPLTMISGAALGWLCLPHHLHRPITADPSGHAPKVVQGWPIGLMLAVWTIVPLLAFVLTAKLIYSRYLVFCFANALIAPATFIGATWSVHLPRALEFFRTGSGAKRSSSFRSLVHVGVTICAVGGAAVTGIGFSVPLLQDPASAPWMNDRRFITDRFQYIESNYAGYGLDAILTYLENRRRLEPSGIVVITRTATGMPRDGVFAYLRDTAGTVLGIVDEGASVTTRLTNEPDIASFQAGRGAPLFYILTDAPHGEQERRFLGLNPNATLILDLPKPGDHSRFKLYELAWKPPVPDILLASPPIIENAVLRGFRNETPRVRAGDTARIVLYWTATAEIRRDLTVFTHVVAGTDEAGGIRIAQRDSRPVGGLRPTTTWRPGEFIADRYEIVIPAAVLPGPYRIVVGMYELGTMARATVAAGLVVTDDDRARLAVGYAVPRFAQVVPAPNRPAWRSNMVEPGVIDGENRVHVTTVLVE